MTTFKTFLLESSYDGLTRVPNEDVISTIENHCPKNFKFAFENDCVLWRKITVDSSSLFSIMREREKKRKSVGDFQPFLNYQEVAKDWKDFPPRSLSSSCALNAKSIIMPWGNLFGLIPFDDVTSFGVMQQDANAVIVDMRKLNVVFSDLYFAVTAVLKRTKTNTIDWNDFLTDPTELKRVGKIFDKFFSNLENRKPVSRAEVGDWEENITAFSSGETFLKFVDLHGGFENTVKYILSPNTFKARTYSSFTRLPFSSATYKDSEVWFKGNALVILPDAINAKKFPDDFLKALDKAAIEF